MSGGLAVHLPRKGGGSARAAWQKQGLSDVSLRLNTADVARWTATVYASVSGLIYVFLY